jgi:CDP-glucose 4,6-dehydratase
VAESYRKSFFAGGRKKALIATARAGNVIGGGDWSKDRLVPDIMRAKKSGKKLIIRNPDAVRPWQHVLEPLEGYLLLAKGLHEGREELACALNFASDEKSFISVGKIVEKSGVKFEVVLDNSKPEMQVLKLDAAKAGKMLGWSGKIGIERALEMAFEWYGKYYSKKDDIAGYTDEQIGKYFAK